MADINDKTVRTALAEERQERRYTLSKREAQWLKKNNPLKKPNPRCCFKCNKFYTGDKHDCN